MTVGACARRAGWIVSRGWTAHHSILLRRAEWMYGRSESGVCGRRYDDVGVACYTPNSGGTNAIPQQVWWGRTVVPPPIGDVNIRSGLDRMVVYLSNVFHPILLNFRSRFKIAHPCELIPRRNPYQYQRHPHTHNNTQRTFFEQPPHPTFSYFIN